MINWLRDRHWYHAPTRLARRVDDYLRTRRWYRTGNEWANRYLP